MLVIKFDAKHGAGQDHFHGALYLNGLFFQTKMAGIRTIRTPAQNFEVAG